MNKVSFEQVVEAKNNNDLEKIKYCLDNCTKYKRKFYVIIYVIFKLAEDPVEYFKSIKLCWQEAYVKQHFIQNDFSKRGNIEAIKYIYEKFNILPSSNFINNVEILDFYVKKGKLLGLGSHFLVEIFNNNMTDIIDYLLTNKPEYFEPYRYGSISGYFEFDKINIDTFRRLLDTKIIDNTEDFSMHIVNTNILDQLICYGLENKWNPNTNWDNKAILEKYVPFLNIRKYIERLKFLSYIAVIICSHHPDRFIDLSEKIQWRHLFRKEIFGKYFTSEEIETLCKNDDEF